MISLKNKKELIEKEYQLPINTIYQDSLTSKLINLSDLKPNGQPQRYDGDWCWTQYARYLTPRSEVQNVIDAKLHPAKETIAIAAREAAITFTIFFIEYSSYSILSN